MMEVVTYNQPSAIQLTYMLYVCISGSSGVGTRPRDHDGGCNLQPATSNPAHMRVVYACMGMRPHVDTANNLASSLSLLSLFYVM